MSKPVVKERPTESAPPVALAVAWLIAFFTGNVDNAQFLWAVALVLTGLPALVTWFAVNHKGWGQDERGIGTIEVLLIIVMILLIIFFAERI